MHSKTVFAWLKTRDLSIKAEFRPVILNIEYFIAKYPKCFAIPKIIFQ